MKFIFPALGVLAWACCLASPASGQSAPVITSEPVSQSVTTGSSLSLSVIASGATSYQWQFDGSDISGATSSILTLSNIGTTQAGSYTVTVSNGSGSTTSATATVSVVSNAHLANISSRGFVGSGIDVMIAGFYIDGSGAKNVLVRGVGPALQSVDSSLSGSLLEEPELVLYNSSGTALDTNTAWGGSETLSNAFSAVGAFSLSSGSDDTALFTSLPSGSTYTAEIEGVGGTTGVALAEIYDYELFTSAPSSYLTNISTRAFVGSGSKVLIAGFYIKGSTSQSVLIRAVGPGLASVASSLSGSLLTKPQLTLYDSSGAVIASNAGWSTAPVAGASTVAAGIQPATASIMSAVGAFSLTSGSADCAIVATLPSGSSYTAQVESADGTSTGIAIVEVYDLSGLTAMASSNSSTSLTTSSSSTTTGTNIVLTATVSPSAATGTVTFYNGTTSLGSAALSSGTASLTTSFSASGTYAITAQYGGDSNYAASTSSAVSVVVASASGGAVTSTTLTATPTSPYVGSTVLLTATVSSTAATGTVTFYNGSTSLGTAALNSGTASLTTSFSSSGSYTLSAQYGGDSNYAASASGSVNEAVSSGSSYSLNFSSYSSSYSTGTMSVTTGVATYAVTYKLYSNIVYVANPVDYQYESMNVYVPVTITPSGGTATTVTASNAPILLDIGVGGYMSISTWGSSQLSTDAQYGLANGYVVVSPGCRGRDSENSSGQYIGKAPAAMVDLKSAVRFIRYNAGTFPGNAGKIISIGGSAGGALSALLGASGNSSLYDSYLASLGAAYANDDIFAVAAYSPITNLDHADMCYEWEYSAAKYDNQEVDQTVSGQLQSLFESYQDGLALTGESSFGTITSSNIDTYILNTYLIPSANKYLASLSSSALSTYLADRTWITWNSSTSTASFTFADYVSYIGRSKALPAFDSFFDASASTFTGENTTATPEAQEFGNATTNARHFTNFSDQYVDNATIPSDEQTIVNMMNPMYYFGIKNSGSAQYWFIRDGAAATDTSCMVIIDLATRAENLYGSSHVNTWEYWDGGHNVNEDPDTFITWINSITGY